MSSKKVEQRTVEMRFDNSQFEKSIAQSQASLAAFNEKLAKIGEGAGSGISSFAASVKSISFDKVNDGIEIGIGKLATLTAAMTGLSKFVDAIYDKIGEIVKQFSTVGNFIAGFDKYTTATESMQSIVSSIRKDGESLEEAMARADGVLEELLWFSDETSYSTTQMTDAIGKFAATGVELNDAKEAIEGIALWSATAGVNTTKAELAFRNLAQAMGQGALKNQDWSSLDLINITTAKFRQLVLDTAVDLKKLSLEGGKYLDDFGDEITVANMRSTLDSGWFDKELMIEVFKKYSTIVPQIKKITDATGKSASDAIEQLKKEGLEAADLFSLSAFELGQEAKTLNEAVGSVTDAASSKFMQIFQVIFGNYVQAKELWTEFANDLYVLFVSPLDSVVDAFKEWGQQEGGRERFIRHIYKIFDNLYEIFSYFKDAWEEVFGNKGTKVATRLNMITDAVAKLSSWLNTFTEQLLKNTQIADNIKTFAKGIKDVIDMVKNAVITAFKTIFKPFKTGGDSTKVVSVISEILAKLGTLLSKLAEYVTENKLVERAMDGLITVATKVKEVFDKIVAVFKKIFTTNTDRTIIWQLGSDAVEFKGPLEIIRDILVTLVDLAGNLITQLTPVVAAVWNLIKAIIAFLGNLITGMAPMIEKAFTYIANALTTATTKMTEFLNGTDFSNPLEAIKEVISKIAAGIGSFIGTIIDSISKVKDANSDKGGGKEKKSFLETVADSIINFSEKLYSHKEAIEWVQTVIFGGKGASTVILELAGALGKLFIALAAGVAIIIGVKKLVDTIKGFIEINPFTVITKAIGGVQSAITGYTKAMTQMAGVKLFQSIGNVILEIAAAFFILALIPADTIKQSAVILAVSLGIITAAVVGILTAVSAFTKSSSFDAKSALQIIGNKGGRLNFGSSGKALNGTGPLYAAVALVAAIGVACLMMAASVAIIGSMSSWDAAVMGFLGLTVIIGAVAGVIVGIKMANFSQKDVSVIMACGILFMAIGKAMQYMGKTIASMANADYENITHAVLGMAMLLAGFVTVFAMIALLRPDPTSMLAAAALVVGMSVMFLAIGAALKIAEKVDVLQAWPVILLIAGIAGAIVLLVGTIAILTKGIGKSEKAVAPMAMIVAIIGSLIGVIIAIAAAIAIIATVSANGGDIEGATKAISIIMGIMLLAIALFTIITAKLNPASLMNSMQSLVIAFGLLSLSVLIIAGALAILASIDSKGVMAAVLAIAGLITVIMLASGALTAIPALQAGLAALSNSLIFIAAAAMGFATSILLVAFAIKIIVDSFVKIVDLGPAAAEQITSMLQAVGVGIVDVFKGVGQGLVEMLNIFLANKSTIIQMGGILISSLIQAFMGFIPAILRMVHLLIENILQILYDMGPGLIDFINTSIAEILFYIVKLTGELLPEINKTLNEVLTDAITNLCEFLVKSIPTINATINIVLFNVVESVLAQIIKITDLVLDALNTLADDLLVRLPLVTLKFTAIGVAVIIAFIGGLIVGVMKGIPTFVEEAAKAFIEMSDALCKVIEDQEAKLYDAFIKLIETVLKAVGRWAGRLYAMTKKGGGKGIFNTICGYLTDGFVEGMNDQRNREKLYNAGKQTFSYYNNGFQSGARIASPSKEMFENAIYVVKGLINGITSKLPDVKSAGTNMANVLSSSFKDSLGGVSDRFKNYGSTLMSNVLSGNGLLGGTNAFAGLTNGNTFDGLLNLNPTITPSLDLSQVASQSKGIDSLLANKQVKSISNINDWSAGQITTAENLKNADALETKGIFTDMQSKLTDLLHVESYNAQKDIDVNVELKGGAKGLFDVMLYQDKKQSIATGVSHFNSAVDGLKKIKNRYINP